MRFETGEVLGKAFSVTIKGFLPFVLIGLIVYIPLFLLVAVAVSSQNPWLLGALGILGWVFSYVVAGAVTYGVVQELKGGPIALGDCLSVGFQRMLPVLGVSIVVGLCVFAGLLLLIVPGIILAVMLFVAVPAAVIERPGIFGAVDRSMSLTKGYRWQVFFISVVIFVVSLIVQMLVGGGTSATATFDPNTGTAIVAEPSVGASLFSMLISMLISLFGAVASAVVYYRLRQVKEDADIEDLASVFE